MYSYTYVSDAVAALLTVLMKGKCGEAYNIADVKSDVMLKDLAGIIANISGGKVIFELPDEIEAAGYSKATKANWLVVTSDNGFAIFKAPEDAEDAWSIVKQLKLGTWGKQNKSIELSL